MGQVVDILKVEDVPAIEAGRSVKRFEVGVFREDILIVVDVVQIDRFGPGIVRVDGELAAETARNLDLQGVVRALSSEDVVLNRAIAFVRQDGRLHIVDRREDIRARGRP